MAPHGSRIRIRDLGFQATRDVYMFCVSEVGIYVHEPLFRGGSLLKFQPKEQFPEIDANLIWGPFGRQSFSFRFMSTHLRRAFLIKIHSHTSRLSPLPFYLHNANVVLVTLELVLSQWTVPLGIGMGATGGLGWSLTQRSLDNQDLE